MPSLECPVDQCAFVTANVEIQASIVLLQIHAAAAHTSTPATNQNGRAPRMERPRVEFGIDMVTWNNFIRRWDLFRSGSNIGEDAAPRQLFECTTEKLRDMVMQADPAIASKTIMQVTNTIRRFAVIPIATSVLRAELGQLRQSPDEPFRAFAARAQGKAETCEFTTRCTCTCGLEVIANYTAEATRDVLLAGIADMEIRREALGTVDIHITSVNGVIALVESKEIARNALPLASSMSTISTTRKCLPLPSASRKCALCYKYFQSTRQEHKLCKLCWQQDHRSRRNRLSGNISARPTLASSNAIEEPPCVGQIGSIGRKKKLRRATRCGHNVSLEHHIFRSGEWHRAKLSQHPTVRIDIGLSK